VLKREERGWWLDATNRDGFSNYSGFRRDATLLDVGKLCRTIKPDQSEIRIENTLTDENGEPARLKEGAQVEVTVEADPEDVEVTSETPNR